MFQSIHKIDELEYEDINILELKNWLSLISFFMQYLMTSLSLMIVFII